MKNYRARILITVFFLFLCFNIFPNKILGGVCEEYQNSSDVIIKGPYRYWTAGWIAVDADGTKPGGEDSLSYDILIKRPNFKSMGITGEIESIKITIKNPRTFNSGVNSTDSATVKRSFVDLNVENQNKILCGSNVVGEPFANCKKNDFCNYLCKKLSNDPDMQLVASDNSQDVIFSYNGGWDKCAKGDEEVINTIDCQVFRKLIGYTSEYGNYGNELQSRTSIQSRAYSMYLSTIKAGKISVNPSSYDAITNKDRVNVSISGLKDNKYLSDDSNIVGSIHRIVETETYKYRDDVTYTLKQNNVGTSYVVVSPVTFEYEYKVTVKTQNNICTEKPNGNDSITNGNCADATLEKADENICTCGERKFTYTSIEGVNKNSENNFCYQTCSSNRVKLIGPTNDLAEYMAGQNFNWQADLQYDIDCDIIIDQKKYNESNMRGKENEYKKCFTTTPETFSNPNVTLEGFKYDNKNYSSLPLEGGKIELIKKCYDNQKNEVDCNDRGNVAKIHFDANSTVTYDTDEFRYSAKGSGISTSSEINSIRNDASLPIHFTELNTTNKDKKSLTIKADFGSIVLKHTCNYKVKNELFGYECLDNKCRNNRNSEEGIDLVFKPISLTEPFAGQDGEGRKIGENWIEEPFDYIEDVITSKTDIYEKEPIYTIRLDAQTINTIRNYNNNHAYNDFNMTCNAEGKNCIRNTFLQNEIEIGGKCSEVIKDSEFEKCITEP